MASVLIFHHQPGNSLLHRSDPRMKFLLYLGWNLYLSFLPLIPAIVMFTVSFTAFLALRNPLPRFLREIRGFFWIFLITWISRAHLSGGRTVRLAMDMLPGRSLLLSWNPDGAAEALAFIVQLAAALVSTHVLMRSTSLSELQDGIFRSLRPLNREFAWKLATMIRIMLSAVPVLMDAASDADRAIRMRAATPKRHPIRYAKGISLALLAGVNRLSGAYTRALLMRAWAPSGPLSLAPLVIDWKANGVVLALLMISAMFAGMLPLLFS